MPYLETNATQRNEIVDLLQCHYISTDRILNIVQSADVDAFFSGNIEPPYVSLYYEKTYNVHAIDTSNIIQTPISNIEVTTTDTPIGILTSRCVQFYYRPTLFESNYQTMPLYFMDMLCVHREKNRTKICRELLQTHEYNQRIANPNVSVSLLKAEVKLLDGVIPLIQYNTATYYLRNIQVPKLPKRTQLIRIYKENLGMLTDYLYTQCHLDFTKIRCEFDICLVPEIGSLLSLIKQQLLYVFCLQRGDEIYGMYFIKDAKLQYEDVEGDTLQCIGSIMDCNSPQIFYVGFMHALKQIIKKNTNYKMLLIEEQGHNVRLTQFWRMQHTPAIVTKTAYYLYNFIYPCSPFIQERCLLLL
jgi:hypothetical protein